LVNDKRRSPADGAMRAGGRRMGRLRAL